MRRIAISGYLLLFSISCSGPKSQPAPDEAEKPRVDVVRLCAEKIKGYQEGATKKADALDVCADMWKEPACREAWTADAEDKTNHVMRTCAAAYCDDNSPWQLCKIPPNEIDIFNDYHDWFALWRAFNHDVLRNDLQTEETGVVGDVAVALLMTLSQQKKEPTKSASTYPEAFFGLALQKTDTGWEINGGVHTTGEPICDTFSVPADNSTDDFKPLMDYLEKNGAGIGTAYIDPNAPLDEKTKTHLIFALRALGVSVIEVFEEQ